jgi:ElaA protein
VITEPVFVTRSFHELSITELYQIYHLRSRIFVVEQNCAYQDPDEKDLVSVHVLMTVNGALCGYCRLIPPGVSYKEAAIGRVAVDKEQRRLGLGKKLMLFGMSASTELFHTKEIVISAQCYLRSFYADLGFEAQGEEYLEDNIPHVKMRYVLKQGSS